MKQKHKIAAFVATYRQILDDAQGGLPREEVFKKMKRSILKWIDENKEISAWQMFLAIEGRIRTVNDIIDTGEQLSFRNFNPECVIQLGTGERVLGRHCSCLDLEAHRGVVVANWEAVTENKDKVITVIDDLLSRMGPDDRVHDVLDANP